MLRHFSLTSDLGAQVQEGTERGATSGGMELEDPSALAQSDFHITTFPATEGTGEILANGSSLFSRIQSIPARVSTSECFFGGDTYVNVGEILGLISPSPAVTGASASVSSTNVAKSLAVLCELDDKATKLMETAFNKYPNLMMVRSDRRKTFIRWMFSSLTNLLQLLSTVSAATFDEQKMSEIEVGLGELVSFGFDSGFIDEMRLQVDQAWEAQSEMDDATSELKTLCPKAEDLNQYIADMERDIAAAKAEVAQVENRISTLCDLAEKSGTPIFKWLESD